MVGRKRCGRGESSELAAPRKEQNILGQEENNFRVNVRAGWEERTEKRVVWQAARRVDEIGMQHENDRETSKKVSGELYIAGTSQSVW